MASSALVIFVPWKATLMSWPTFRSRERLAIGSFGVALVGTLGAQAAIALAAAARSSARLFTAGAPGVSPPRDARPRAPRRGPRARPARRHRRGARAVRVRARRRMGFASRRAPRHARA